MTQKAENKLQPRMASSVNTCGVGACVVIQPVSGNVAIRQHSSSARAVMAMSQPIVLILTN